MPKKPPICKITTLLSIFTILITTQIILFTDQNNRYQKYYRQLVKRQNTKLIEEHNNDEGNGFQLSPNDFIELTIDQFYSMYTTTVKVRKGEDEEDIVMDGITNSERDSHPSLKGSSIDDNSTQDTFQTIITPQQTPSIAIDLTPYTTPPKDQGKCNSCYSHSAIATVQTLLFIRYNTSYDLSQQQIVQCTANQPTRYNNIEYNNLGCYGGWGWISLEYIVENGVTYEVDYPYVSRNSTRYARCSDKTVTSPRFRIATYEYFYNKRDPESQCPILNQKLLQGKTIAASIWVPKTTAYQFYGRTTPGIDLFDLCGSYDDVNHELQLVGSTDQYWKLKNSYGTSWGEGGFLYLDKKNGLNCMNVCMDFAVPGDLVGEKVVGGKVVESN